MNILTFDIEEWYIEKVYGGDSKKRYSEFDRLLNRILNLLDEHNLSATFFCLGRIASDFPHVVRTIAQRGHEIGSHSHMHRWVNKMTPDEFQADTAAAVSAIEDVTGQKVVSFRAPAFSIGEHCKWAIDILAANGIENDASIFPGVRDFGGFPAFTEQKPCIIEYNGCQIKEFPIPLYKLPLIGTEIAYSGGGYFRLLPLSLAKSQISKSDYSMCYFHIEDLLPEKAQLKTREEYERYFNEPGPLYKRLARYFKANVGRSLSIVKFENLLAEFNFCSISEYKDHNEMFCNIVKL